MDAFFAVMSQAISFVLHIDQHLFALVQTYGVALYAILFCVVFCETGLVVTPFLPGDSLLFAAGTLAGAGYFNYLLSLAVLAAAAILGDAVNYSIGRKSGTVMLTRETRFLNKDHLRKACAFYERHGGKAIILARFIPIIRTFAPFAAGMAEMHPGRFFAFNVAGGLLWVFGLVSAGYFLGNIPWVRDHFSTVVYAIIVVSVMPVAIGFLRSRFAHKEAC